MKTLIAIPCMGTVPWEFAQSLIYLNKGENVSVMFRPDSLIYDARNLISLTAIENHFDRVMWFDSDVVFQPDTLQKLHRDMDEHGCDMVSGLYVKRSLPTEPVIYETIREPERQPDGRILKQIVPFTDYPHDDVFTIAGCGFGCVLMSVKLLQAVWNQYGPAFAPYPWASEDISFCYRAQHLGYHLMCDSSVSCGHVGTYIYTDRDLKRGDAH